MRKILIVGYYGFENCGDDALLLAIVKSIKNLNKKIEITALSYKPEETMLTYNINAIDRFKLKEVISEIKKSDVIIFGGGTLLQDKTSTRSLLYYLSIINISKIFNKTIVLYSNGFGPITKKHNKFLTRRTLEKVDLLTLRDERALNDMRNIGIKNKNVYVTADLAFTIDITTRIDVNELFAKESIPIDKPLVGVLIRNWGENDYLDELSYFCDEIVKKRERNIVLIPMQYPEDNRVSEELIKKSKEKIYIIKGNYSIEEKFKIIGSTKLNICMRLHGLIISATENIPILGLVYDPKVKAYLDLLGMPILGNIEEGLKREEMLEEYNNLEIDYDQCVEKLKETSKDLKVKAEKNIDYLKKIL